MSEDPDISEVPDRPPCTKCGQVHNGCTAHKRHTGAPCGNVPRLGSNVCYYHGGKNPLVMKAADRRVTEAKWRAKVTQMLTGDGIEVEQRHPIDVLLQAVWRSSAAAEIYGQLVATLDLPQEGADMFETVIGADGESYGIKRFDQLVGLNKDNETTAHIFLRLWNEERDRSVRYAAEALKAGVAERMVQLAESQSKMMVDIIRSILDDPELGLSDETRFVARRVAARVLRNVAGAQTPIGIASGQ